MSENLDAQSSSSTRRAIAQTFRLTGQITFWAQLVLGLVSGGILLFATFSANSSSGARGVTGTVSGTGSGTGLGIFFAICGLVVLGIGIFISFRYIRIGRQLDSSNPSNHPRKLETVQVVRLGLILHLVGILLTLIGAQAIVGILLTKSLTVSQIIPGTITQVDPSRVIQPLDIFVVQANTNTISAHFAGLLGSIWLLNRITKP